MVLQDLLLLRQDLVRSQESGCGGPELEQAIKALSEIVARVRTLCRELRPSASCFGFPKDLNNLIGDIQRIPEAPQILTQIDLPAQVLSPVYSSLALRAIREALMNVIKHAKAQTVQVSLSVTDDQVLRIEVADDGVGFEPPLSLREFEKQDHFGLINTTEQVRLRGGNVELTSARGVGTTLLVTVPLMSQPYYGGGD